MIIRNGNVLLESGDIQICDIRIEKGLVSDIGIGLQDDTVFDATGCYVIPGLIDLHTHGIQYESALNGDCSKLSEIEASCGATSFYLTLFGPPEIIAQRMISVREQTNELALLPQIAGFRLESPYLAIPSGGTDKDVTPITKDTTAMLLEAGGGHIKIWDVSPELPGAVEVIRYLSDIDIVCSIAHTHATIAQAKNAVDAGATLVTHFFDVFGPPETTDPDPDITPVGIVDYLAVEDRVTCEIIADGTHVHPLLVERALRCKTPDRIAFVTDGNIGAGLVPGKYVLPGGWGEALIMGPNDGVRIPDRGMCLAGSALSPINNLLNAMELFGRDLATASKLCSLTPAKLLGLNKGIISKGYDADIIILNSDLSLKCTISQGNTIYIA